VHLTKVIFFVHSLLCLTDAVLRDLDVASYFNPTLLSEDTGFEKPSPEIFLRACRESDDSRTPSKPEECVHVGDELDWSVSYATLIISELLTLTGVVTITVHGPLVCMHCCSGAQG
jgi:hypothetical protein